MRNLPVYSEPTLRAMTFIRAGQWVAVVLTGWSLSLRWGDEIAAGKGPPSQWERHVVGATLLLVVAALSMTATARGKTSGAPPPPSTLALVVSAGCAAAALGITLWLRSTALSRELGHVLLGGGWLWMLSGTALALGSTSFALIVRLQGTRAAPGSNKRVKRKRV